MKKQVEEEVAIELKDAQESSVGATTEGGLNDGTSVDFKGVVGNGIIGLLERIPLLIKLLAMVAVAATGYFALGAILLYFIGDDMSNAKLSTVFQDVSSQTGKLISAIQNEREITNSYILTRATNMTLSMKYYGDLMEQKDNTDI